MDNERDATESESRLLERLRGGDPTAFDDIVRRHRLAVYRVARRVLGSHEAADEAAQETFVRAWRSIGRFRGESQLSTWLIRIALNVSRTLGAARPRSEPIEAAGSLLAGGRPADAAVAGRESLATLRRAVALLPPRQREVVALKVYSDMTYDDVADAMGLTVGAVKAHFHQAVSNLRRRMAGKEPKG